MLNSRLKVPSGSGGRIIIAYVRSRNAGLLHGERPIFIAKSNNGDCYDEMNFQSWLE